MASAAFPIKFKDVDEDQKDEEVSIQNIVWDPMSSSDWNNERPTSEAIVRIKRDLQVTFSDPPPGIFVVPHGDDITKLSVLIIGPFDTPYEGGFFQFLLRFPPNYPFSPPRVKFLTTGDGTVRFNPNLYRNGKVCLSILGYLNLLFSLPSISTWPGPQWTPSQNLLSVIVSIQSLLNDKPYHNEPGFEKEARPGDVENYNNIILHETLRVAVCGRLERNLASPELMEIIQCSFKQYFDYYCSAAKKFLKLDGQPMLDPFSINKGKFCFSRISQRLETLYSKLN